MMWLCFSYTWLILHSGDTPYSFIRSSVGGYLGWSHSAALKEYYTTQKDASMSSIYRLALLCLIPRSGMVWPCSHSTLGKHAHCCANLHSHHSYIRMSFSLHIFWVKAILIGVRWTLSVVFILIFLLAEGIEHWYVMLGPFVLWRGDCWGDWQTFDWITLFFW